MAGAVARTEAGRERAVYLDGGVFAVRHEPAKGNGRGVVICPPLLADFLANYHREVSVARRLASAGYTVLRFHYRGTGSSARPSQSLTLEATVEDGLAAVGSLGDVEEVVLVGTRLSTVVAAEVRNRSGGGRLILWDPFINSRTIFREGFRARRARQVADQDHREDESSEDLRSTLEAGGAVDLLGCRLDGDTYGSFMDLDLAQRLAAPGPLLLVPFGEASEGSAAGRLADDARARGFEVAVTPTPTGESWWFQDEHDRVIGTLAEDMLAWLGGTDDVHGSPSTPSTIEHDEWTDNGLVLRPRYLTTDIHTLFGLQSRAESVAPRFRAVQIMGAGRYPSSGRNQFRAKLSSAVVRHGGIDLRIDRPGVGESLGELPPRDLANPDPSEGATISAFLQAEPPLPLLVVAQCYGTRIFFGILDGLDDVIGAVLFLPPVRNEDHFEAAVRERPIAYLARGSIRNFSLQALVDRSSWHRVRREIARTIRAKRREAGVGGRQDASSGFVRGIKALLGRDVPVLIVFPSRSNFYRDFEAARDGELGQVLADAGDRVEVLVFEGTSSLCSTTKMQDDLVGAVSDWIGRRVVTEGRDDGGAHAETAGVGLA